MKIQPIQVCSRKKSRRSLTGWFHTRDALPARMPVPGMEGTIKKNILLKIPIPIEKRFSVYRPQKFFFC